MNLLKGVGSRIRKIRKSKNWTQEQLAEAATLHYSYIGGVERGDRNISLETLEKIVTALDVPAWELFRHEDISDKQFLLHEHINLISNRSAEEIALITKITKDIISAMELHKE
ncbi:helix-turn-helix domain-containing protein [Paenibacillus lentus]|uniref:XRE family transcriptional regulator n=1 Tax=Paenibacillus lentus TaxID=1338368 RepID=A0A3Q8S410_9BACL|nr:helix-turn-helix transcriptional regulator [Paenibacillus lentus]AZK45700.1 XRE family transcriptional regulator [Paenibacillus lentus]